MTLTAAATAVAAPTSKPPATGGASTTLLENHPLILTLRRIDPVLQFLTKATGLTSVPLPTVQRTFPQGCCAEDMLGHVRELSELGILSLHWKAKTGTLHSTNISESSCGTTSNINTEASATFSQTGDDIAWDNTQWHLGFPPSAASLNEETKHQQARQCEGTLHGSTKTAAKRRLAALKRIIKERAKKTPESRHIEEAEEVKADQSEADKKQPAKAWDEDELAQQRKGGDENETGETVLEEEKEARDAVFDLFGFEDFAKDNQINSCQTDRDAIPTTILPKQLSYAGSNPAQESIYAKLSEECMSRIPNSLLKAFELHPSSVCRRRLYRHQAQAIEAAMNKVHCTICTGTGSGKSLCFLLPILISAYHTDSTALVLFPTKALAQDQLTKLNAILSKYSDLAERIRPSTLDGDTPHSSRAKIAESANIILTNPDTLHAAILPSWKSPYKNLLARLNYVVIDEAHMYDGVFGAHVAMVLSRLARICIVAAHTCGYASSRPTFLGTSATLPWPEQHFRRLCPIAQTEQVKILTNREDGSPRSAKHFFVWNPPVLNNDGSSTGKVTFPPVRLAGNNAPNGRKRERRDTETITEQRRLHDAVNDTECADEENTLPMPGHIHLHRRHAADEIAVLLAKAVIRNVRCIAFCKTRNLVEWVYERACAALKGNPQTEHLVPRVESYRGGYSMIERRKIEEKLFQNELLGVVGTNALELGVDIGNVDVILHCGYPSSYASLLQQAGRAGRGAGRAGVPSLSIIVCFNSPSEQHLWRHPQTVLAKGISAPNTIPISSGVVQGHMLCASGEFPLTGGLPVTSILGPADIESRETILSDVDLFGGEENYQEALQTLKTSRSVVEESVPRDESKKTTVFRAHEIMRKAWSKVSIRSIEPVNYTLVDVSHPGQAGRMDRVHDETAIMDIVPYSRVFYHAHPGAVVTHRGRRYKVISMVRPPAFLSEQFNYRRNFNLSAFAKPTNARYATRPLSKLFITVLKTFDSVELPRKSTELQKDGSVSIDDSVLMCTFAGCGAISVKRTVHGYKKLSLITRAEISRTELSLPDLEFDSYGIWIDAAAEDLLPALGEKYGPGVHALSHALLAVAPLVSPGICRSDLECDHSFVSPTLITLFDERAGGSGACQRLWDELFRPDGLLESAIKLLEECSSCGNDKGYDGGCPECLHASNCIKFNMHLSRSAAIVIGKRMLGRTQQTHLYKQNARSTQLDSSREDSTLDELTSLSTKKDITPRRKARQRALQTARDMQSARDRQIVVGRPSWPLDGDEVQGRQVHGDL